MNDNIKKLALIILYNCVLFGCFTLLAIFFGKWWIILLAIIFFKWSDIEIIEITAENEDTKDKE